MGDALDLALQTNPMTACPASWAAVCSSPRCRRVGGTPGQDTQRPPTFGAMPTSATSRLKSWTDAASSSSCWYPEAMGVEKLVEVAVSELVA